jgi:hypothetical protein
MTDTTDRFAHLIEGLRHLESLAVQLSTTMRAAEGDLEALSKAAFSAGGKPAAERFGTALTIDALHGLLRGRLHALGLDALLQRSNHATEPGWIDEVADRLRRSVG